MIRQAVTVAIFASATSLSFAQTPQRVNWDFKAVPITVEVVRDVPVGGRTCGARGTLCTSAEFVIPRGGRFQMLEVGLEGGCTIEYQQSRYEVSSCPWVLGFTDPQAEVFVIVEVPRIGG